jgi:DNA-binding XRE family transcriptional regulator
MTQPAEHALFDRWTGRHASTLQAALRMSQDEMAAKLGVSKRTVASWHEKPNVVIRPELQRALDVVYERAPEAVKLRFARQLSADDAAGAGATGQAVALTASGLSSTRVRSTETMPAPRKSIHRTAGYRRLRFALRVGVARGSAAVLHSFKVGRSRA